MQACTRFGDPALLAQYLCLDVFFTMDELTRRERSKYERMAAQEGYGNSFELQFVNDAIAQLGIPLGGKLWDFGAGTGKCILAFRQAGIEASGFDITKDRVKPEAEGYILQTTLWDLPKDVSPHDCGFCSDVMEHIPTEKVDDVLKEIARLNIRGIYFTISLVQDNCGKLIGEPLHLTVKPIDWWEARLKLHWTHVLLRAKNATNVIFVARDPLITSGSSEL